MSAPCPLCGAPDGEPHEATCRRGLATFRRVTDHAVLVREVVRRDAGFVHFIESGRHRRAFGPRPGALPASSFDRWAAGAQALVRR